MENSVNILIGRFEEMRGLVARVANSRNLNGQQYRLVRAVLISGIFKKF